MEVETQHQKLFELMLKLGRELAKNMVTIARANARLSQSPFNEVSASNSIQGVKLT
jgi:hypothetical protein